MIRRTLLALGLLLWQPAQARQASFKDQPVVWRVDDARPIPEPREREFTITQYGADIFFLKRLERALSLPDREPAWDTNALDELPDSTWFTNRIGRRPISPQEAARGPVTGGPPQPPLTVVHGKGGGGNPGFFARDTTGRTFLVKFDRKDNPEMQTATAVIVNRAFWTLGYNVPEDTVFRFRREDLSVDPDATTRDALGRRVPVTREAVDAILDTAPLQADGSIRAGASLLLEGIPKGGFAAMGTRPDDPNDRVPHQHRRELRALRVFNAWLGHTDIKEDNTLDMYVEQDGRHFLRHYLLDFGEALGAHQAEKGRMEDGWEYWLDWQKNGLALLSLGLWRRPWEDQQPTPWLSVGAFSGEQFDPLLWREAYPYWPIREADAADLFWGAKLVMRFDRPLVEAIVAAGELPQPQAAAYLVDALLQRRERIGHAWLEALSPLDELRIGEDSLCMVDLGVRYGLASDGVVERLPPRYRPDLDDAWSESESSLQAFRVAADGAVCLPLSGEGGYTVDRLRVRRGRERKPVMQVHYIWGEGAGEPRILGLIREERGP